MTIASKDLLRRMFEATAGVVQPARCIPPFLPETSERTLDRYRSRKGFGSNGSCR